MMEKQARKFEKLRTAWLDAVEARRSAAKANKALRESRPGDASEPGAMTTKAVLGPALDELDALKAERRALKKLLHFAEKNFDDEMLLHPNQAPASAKADDGMTSATTTRSTAHGLPSG
jgi:hypothetical protein